MNPWDNATNVLSAGAVISPFWLPVLEQTSGFAALLAPILGAIWLVIQIWAKIKEYR